MPSPTKQLQDLLNGQPGPFLQTDNHYFGKKQTNPTMKNAPMETDCGGTIITRAKLTYGEADQITKTIDYPALTQHLKSCTGPTIYWKGLTNKTNYGEIYWAIYNYLTINKIIEGDPNSYNNSMEYLYGQILNQLTTKNHLQPTDNTNNYYKPTQQ